MHENKSLVQEALLQMKNVEEAIAENAKGILASTMKEEINQLVKESLSEEDDEKELDVDIEDGPVDMGMSDDEMSDDESSDMMGDDMEEPMDDMEIDMIDMDSDETPIDLTKLDDDEKLLKVFKAMGEDDGIIVVKDDDEIHLTDNEGDNEYIIKLGESVNKRKRIDEMEDPEVDELIDKLFSEDEDLGSEFSDEELEEDFEEETEEDVVYEVELDDTMHDELEEDDEEDDEEVVYEVEFDEMMHNELEEESMEDSLEEAYSHKKAKKVSVKGEMKGHGPKFSYKKTTGGFKENMKPGPKSVGTGNVKKAKVFPKGENMEVGKNKIVKKETKEAARTYAFGRPGSLRKGVTNNRNQFNVKKESLEAEVNMLREKNEEYRKALNVFREKLNEVAIFNSNLAYATRLFTEHSTTKKEKINILRRFDGVETLKESKNLYKSIKDELTKVDSKPITESVEVKLNKQVSSGSSTNLIESKTYENPQFMRIKDLMGKMN